MNRHPQPQHMAEFKVALSLETIDRFFDATGWALPSRPPLPPTIATRFREGELLALQKLGVSLENVLHGDQEYKYFAGIRINEDYIGQTYLVQVHERSSGAAKTAFYVFRTDISDAAGNKCLECTTTLIARAGQ